MMSAVDFNVGAGGNLRAWEKLDCWLREKARWSSSVAAEGGGNSHTHPPEVQGKHEYEVGSEYNEEVPRRILRNDVQYHPDLDPQRLRTFRQKNE